VQVDESTDVAGLSVVLTFVRYIYNSQVEEEVLVCTYLPINNIGEDSYYLTDLCLAEKSLSWKQSVHICTDSTCAMVQKMHDFIGHIKAIAPECSISHSIIQCQGLAVKHIPDTLIKLSDEVVKIVNFVKSRPMNSRIFGVLCDEMGNMTMLFFWVVTEP
jgi:hypothetical protein